MSLWISARMMKCINRINRAGFFYRLNRKIEPSPFSYACGWPLIKYGVPLIQWFYLLRGLTLHIADLTPILYGGVYSSTVDFG